MKCVILAAGYATRLYPITEKVAKPLLEIKGKTILDWLYADLESQGKINEYIIVSNHKFFFDFLKWANDKENVTVIDDGSTNNENRVGAVKDILFAITTKRIDEDILVIAGDNVLDFSLNGLIENSDKTGTTTTLRYFEKDYNILRKSGVAIIDERGMIKEMYEKKESPSSHWIIPPFYVIRRVDLPLIRKAIEMGCATDAPGSLIAWMSSSTPVFSILMSGKRYDIGDIESYEYAKINYKGIVKGKI